ncbi:outer membrane beta-barrel protein [Agarivorans sp. MS3-6]|uniref:outer membrane beta-barrel protein n=1 Tax=Agarivorans sp. TSD2052 TaxID=2937286 RepID=UPI00200DA8A6|nr:outer membrane beta-barrel protein [Agarivorans sp. TSD2052]UPW18408.1 hypothetical protein M0C34_19635 [Agarivorans sp. TSD2052]
MKKSLVALTVSASFLSTAVFAGMDSAYIEYSTDDVFEMGVALEIHENATLAIMGDSEGWAALAYEVDVAIDANKYMTFMAEYGQFSSPVNDDYEVDLSDDNYLLVEAHLTMNVNDDFSLSAGLGWEQGKGQQVDVAGNVADSSDFTNGKIMLGAAYTFGNTGWQLTYDYTHHNLDDDGIYAGTELDYSGRANEHEVIFSYHHQSGWTPYVKVNHMNPNGGSYAGISDSDTVGWLGLGYRF